MYCNFIITCTKFQHYIYKSSDMQQKSTEIDMFPSGTNDSRETEFVTVNHCWNVREIICEFGVLIRLTRSSAVAKRPRDASCLSVVSFVVSIVQYLERSLFIISYFSFGFTSAYNLILFCCLRRITSSLAVIHIRSIVIVYSERAHLVILALKNHGDGDFIVRGAWWSNTCSVRPAI